VAGRRPDYTIYFAIYIAANVSLALQNSFAALSVLRCLQSSWSSGTIALSSGVVADIATASERGKWVGWVMQAFCLDRLSVPLLVGFLPNILVGGQYFGFDNFCRCFLCALPDFLSLNRYAFQATHRSPAEKYSGRNIVGMDPYRQLAGTCP
jgi:MFS family permease